MAVSTRSVDAGTAIKLDLAGLVRGADVAFEGRVIASRVLRDEQGRIATEHTLSIDRTFLGEPYGTRTIKLPGGVLPDGSGMLLPGMPRVEVGEDVLLFLSQESSGGLCMPVGLAQGKFKVVREAHKLASLVREQADLMLVDPQAGTVAPARGWSALDYAATVREIEDAVAAKLAAGTQGR